jgi:hypothetical protein
LLSLNQSLLRKRGVGKLVLKRLVGELCLVAFLLRLENPSHPKQCRRGGETADLSGSQTAISGERFLLFSLELKRRGNPELCRTSHRVGWGLRQKIPERFERLVQLPRLTLLAGEQKRCISGGRHAPMILNKGAQILGRFCSSERLGGRVALSIIVPLVDGVARHGRKEDDRSGLDP